MKCLPTPTVLAMCTLAVSAQSSKFPLPELDAARISFRQTGDLDLGGGQGRLEITQYELRSVLGRPVGLADDWLLVPMAEFTETTLNFAGTPAASPFHDQNLYSIGLSAAAVHLSQSSPWIYGAWARAELASDFERVTNDAFTVDLAAGGAYRCNEHFTLGLGAAVFNLNGNVTGYPLVGFDWIVSDAVRIGLYGPTFVTACTCIPDWLFSIRAKAGGGFWNVSDAAGNPHAIDLTTYQLGLFADRRLIDTLWLSAGMGVSLGNQLEYTTPHGDTLYRRAPEAGLFGQIGLRLKAW